LSGSRGAQPQPDEDRIAAYLKEGALLVACPGVVGDVLDSGVKDVQDPAVPIGSAHILTDGAWAWPADLEYYVRTYHVRLPADFIEHMRTHQWRPPAESELDFEHLSL
jgi:hypothetical protein